MCKYSLLLAMVLLITFFQGGKSDNSNRTDIDSLENETISTAPTDTSPPAEKLLPLNISYKVYRETSRR